MEDYRLEQSGQEVQDILNGAATQVDLTAENERAELAEQTLQGNIDIEERDRKAADLTLQGNIDAEELRAKAAEKQNADDIDALEEKVPSGASASNKLATESYVDDSVATATATFRGTYNLVSDLHLTVNATEQQIATALALAISTADNNDYCFVQVPTSSETPTEIKEIDRYKFNGTAWSFEYKLNNSGFTAAQWAAINSGITSGDVTKLAALPTNAELTTLLAGKQDVLTFDNVPTEGSSLPVKSGGVYSAIGDEKTARENADSSLSSAIEAILLLIPSAATSLNKLADKAFVNSSIATASATFRGTYNLVTDLSLTVSATHAQIATALAGAVSDEDNNDYAFVQIPTSDATPTQIAKTERYKFNGTAWEYEYDLNNSGYTAAQWAAINSGITEALVTKLSALPTNTELTSALGVLTSSITTINQKIPSAASQANQLVDTAAMESYIVQVLDVLTASFNVTSTDGHVTVQISQVDGKITSVSVSTSDIASASDLSLIAGRVTTAEGNISTNAADIANLQDAYAALTQSDIVVVEGALPSTGQQINTIYRQPDPDHTPPQFYSDYMWNGTAWVLMATYNNAIDDVPTAGSNNLVKSGGVNDALLLKSDKEDTDILTKVFKKQIIPLTTGSETIKADTNGKMEVSIPAKHYFDVLLKDPQNSISAVGGVYSTYPGSTTRHYIGSLVANVKKTFYTDVEIDHVCIFVARANMNPDTAITELCVYDEQNAAYNIAQNNESINSIEDDILHRRAHFENPNTVNVEKFFSYSKKEGEILKAKVVDYNGTLTQVNLYVLYEGAPSHTPIAELKNTNSFKYEGILAGNITRVDFYILGQSFATGDINCDFIIESGIQEELARERSAINENAVKIYGISEDLYAKWEDELSVTEGSEVSPNLTKQAVDIKAGDKFSIEVIDDDESLTDNAIKGLYAFYVSDPTEQVNLMYDAVTNTEYEFTALEDIAYIGIWVLQGVVIMDSTLLVVVEGSGLVKKVEDLEKKSIDAFNQDANDALKRFIPISSTTPDDDIVQLSDSDLKENVNLLFMTDSHIDYLAATESMENVRNTVGFANRCKRVIQLVNSRLNNNLFDAVIHTGDILTSSHADKNITLGYARSFFNVTQELESPLLFAPGNHDRNDSNQVPSNVITDEDWMTLYGDYAEQNYGIVRQVKANGKKSQWFYYDIADKKVRVISVYVNDVDYSVTNEGGKVLYNESNGWYIAQEQMSWLINTALDFDDKDEKDWGVVVIIHQSMRITSSLENKPWYSTGSAITNPAYQFESSIQKFFEVCKAFNTQGTYSNSYSFATDSFFDLTISADFTRYANLAKKPHMICWLNGHEHIDYSMVKDGINIIWTGQHSAMNAFSDMRVPRIIGTSTQNLFDLISIETTHRKIRIVRVGAGVNCYGGGLLYGDRFMPNGISY